MGARVVRLVGWCDLDTEEDARARFLADPPDAVPESGTPVPGRWVPAPDEPVLPPGMHFAVQEHAVLDDGRRLVLHAERGWTSAGPAATWARTTEADLCRDVLNVVLGDDAEETGEDHPWKWLADLLDAQGVAVDPVDLAQVPYLVELSDRVLARLAQAKK